MNQSPVLSDVTKNEKQEVFCLHNIRSYHFISGVWCMVR